MTFDPTFVGSKSHENTSKYVDTVTFFAKNFNQRSLTPRWPLTPHLLRSHVWLYPRITVSKSHENTSKYVDTVTLFAKTWTKGHWPLDDLWPHICWGHMCDSTQGSLCPSPMGIHQCMWIQWSILQITNQRSLAPDDLWSHICWGLMCDSTQHCVQVPWIYIKVCGYSDPFCKNLNQRSLTPRWPLTPHLLRSHVWLYPRIIVSKSHGYTSMYLDTVINFANHHIHTYTYYVLRTTYGMSDHIVSAFRRDKNDKCHDHEIDISRSLAKLQLRYVFKNVLFQQILILGYFP